MLPCEEAAPNARERKPQFTVKHRQAWEGDSNPTQEGHSRGSNNTSNMLNTRSLCVVANMITETKGKGRIAA